VTGSPGGSLAGEISGEVVFVGYGIEIADPAYDDYAGVDVRGKIALALVARRRSWRARVWGA
jgi:hypothetical protein